MTTSRQSHSPIKKYSPASSHERITGVRHEQPTHPHQRRHGSHRAG